MNLFKDDIPTPDRSITFPLPTPDKPTSPLPIIDRRIVEPTYPDELDNTELKLSDKAIRMMSLCSDGTPPKVRHEFLTRNFGNS